MDTAFRQKGNNGDKTKERFRRGLIALRKKAGENHDHITVPEILSSFPEMTLNQDQITLVYRYLEEEHIVVEDYILHDTRQVPITEKELTGEEKAYFQMYLDDLNTISPCSEEEEIRLVAHLLDGDEIAQNRLIEGNLHRVLKLARARAGYGVLMGDLVQEGNMALITAIEEYRIAGVRHTGDSWQRFLEGKIDEAMKALIAEQGSFSRAAEAVAKAANRLMDATEELEEELGRTVTLEELAERLSLTSEDVENIMRISYQAMEKGDVAEDEGEEKNNPMSAGWVAPEEF